MADETSSATIFWFYHILFPFFLHLLLTYVREWISDPKYHLNFVPICQSRKINRLRLRHEAPSLRYHLRSRRIRTKKHRFQQSGFKSQLWRIGRPPVIPITFPSKLPPAYFSVWHILAWKIFRFVSFWEISIRFFAHEIHQSILDIAHTSRWVLLCIAFSSFSWVNVTFCKPLVHSAKCASNLVAYAHQHSNIHATSSTSVLFDTDSIEIGVDTHASATMSGIKDCFENLILSDELGECSGISSGLKISGVGTFVFKLEDDTGQPHIIKIPHSIYIPDLPLTLLSPQHWAQEAKDHSPTPEGTGCRTNSTSVIIFWDQGRFERTIPMNPKTNTPSVPAVVHSSTVRSQLF